MSNALDTLRRHLAHGVDVETGKPILLECESTRALARVEAVIEAAPRLLRWVELVTQSRVGEGRYAANDDMFELDARELYNLMHAAEPLAAALAALDEDALLARFAEIERRTA